MQSDARRNFAEACDEIFRSAFGAPSRPGATYLPFTMGNQLDHYQTLGTSQRNLDISTGDALIASRHDGTLINSLQPYSGVIAAGAKVVTGLERNGTFVMPRVNTGSGVFWIVDGEAAGTADPSFEQCQIASYTLAATLNISRLLQKGASLAQSIEVALSGEIQRAMLTELDRVALNGSGSGQPRGLLQDPSVGVFAGGVNGAAPSLGLMTDIEYELGSVFSGGPLTWFTNSATRRKIRRTATGAGLAPMWSEANTMLGHSTAITEHVPSDYEKGDADNLSATVLGDFSQLTIGIWGAPAFEILFNPYGVAPNGTAQLSVFLDVGIGINRSEAFVACKDLITTVS